VREESLYFGEGGRLFGVLTEPGAGSTRRAWPAVVFLNVGANHRVGPHRMYITLARELAARGYLGLRFDLAGLGDSLVADGAPENRLYSKDSIGDVKAALTFLPASAADRVVPQASAGRVPGVPHGDGGSRVAGQILINPQTSSGKKAIRRAVDPQELQVHAVLLGAVLDREVWAQRCVATSTSRRGRRPPQTLRRPRLRVDRSAWRADAASSPRTDIERLSAPCRTWPPVVARLSSNDGAR
jgi:hypothetical protein